MNQSPGFPTVARPDPAATRPLVVSNPHAGEDVPDEERPLYLGDVDALLRDGDLYVDRLVEGAEVYGATVLGTPWSRFVIDLNRLPDDTSARSVAGTRARRGPGYYGDRGIIWAVTTHGEPIYRRPLKRREFERRRDRYYTPYHDRLAAELADLRERFGSVVLLDAHSMPSRAARMHSDRSGAARADIVPGDVDGTSCAPWLSDLVEQWWRDAGYTVRRNQPYRGGGITRRHADPANGVHAIQLEVNRALYMDEDTLEPHDGLQTLRADYQQFIRALAEASLAHC